MSAGKSTLLDTPAWASGCLPWAVSTSWPCGVYFSASVGAFTTTLTGTSSWLPSGYVTTTVPVCSPGVSTSSGAFQLYFVSAGKSDLLDTPA